MSKNEKYKILWDFTIQTDHVLEARRAGMIAAEIETNVAK